MEFKIEYPNGSVSIVVENYFAKSTIPDAKNLFKLAKRHCTEIDRQLLIANLHDAKVYWSEWYKRFRSYQETLSHTWDPNTQVRLRNLHTKLDKIINILVKEKWGD